MAQRVAIKYNKLGVMVLLVTVIYNEYYSYYSTYRSWPTLGPAAEGVETTRILFVADPQIQGYRDEPFFPLGTLTRWDSDRYLSKNFQWALYAYKPEIVVFLGDLIDEASTTTDIDVYAEYVARFRWIYPKDSARVMIYLPGDNDIGGEGSDPLTDLKVRRFEAAFSENMKQAHSYRVTPNIDIIPVDYSMDRGNISFVVSHNITKPYPDPKNIRIIVSHSPVMPMLGSYTSGVLSYYQPSVIFSAHYHKGMEYLGSPKTGRSLSSGPPTVGDRGFKFFTVRSESTIRWNFFKKNDTFKREINVPTCSYRMGVGEMAFGLLSVDENSGDAEYHNLWLGSRFPLLYIYISASITASVLFCFNRFSHGFSSAKKPRSRRSSFMYDRLV